MHVPQSPSTQPLTQEFLLSPTSFLLGFFETSGSFGMPQMHLRQSSPAQAARSFGTSCEMK